MSQEQHLKPGTLPASRPDVLPRPKAYTDILADLDGAGWVYYVRWALWTDESVQVKVTGVAPWDHALRVEVEWTSADGTAPLTRTRCATGRPYRALAPASLRAVRELIAAKPEPRDGGTPC